jgi:hypothetical protein
VSELVAILTISQVVKPNERYDFGKVCSAAAHCWDQSFFQQVAHCVALEGLPAFERLISDRTVMRAYQAAQEIMQEEWTPPGGKGIILREWIPTAAAVAKQLDLIMKTNGTTAAAVVDLCARKSLALKLKKNGKVGRPRNK